MSVVPRAHFHSKRSLVLSRIATRPSSDDRQLASGVDAHPAVAVAVGVPVGVPVGVSVGMGGSGVFVAVATAVAVGSAVAVEVAVVVGTSVAVGFPVAVSVAVSDAVAVFVSVGLGTTVAVGLGVSVGFSVGVALGISVCVAVAVAVPVSVGVEVALCVLVRVTVGKTQLPAPLQLAKVLQKLLVCWKASTNAHQPFGWPVLFMAHDRHTAVQPASQQMPSTQLLEAHWASLAQAAPGATSQLPAPLVPLHAEDPLQPFSVCSVPTTVAHTPSCMPVLAAAHD